MPPKPKYTRDEIVLAAINLVNERGIDVLTARELARYLGCSTRPIFTAFADMDELRHEVRAVTARKLSEAAYEAMRQSGDPQQGLLLVLRSANGNPNLFKLVYMMGGDSQQDMDGVFRDSVVFDEDVVALTAQAYGLSNELAHALCIHNLIFALGIGTLCVTQRYAYSEDEITQLLQTDVDAMLQQLRSKEGMKDKATDKWRQVSPPSVDKARSHVLGV